MNIDALCSRRDAQFREQQKWARLYLDKYRAARGLRPYNADSDSDSDSEGLKPSQQKPVPRPSESESEIHVHDNSCVICYSAPKTSGFLHGDTVHAVVCKTCAQKTRPGENCPMCRLPIERVVRLYS